MSAMPLPPAGKQKLKDGGLDWSPGAMRGELVPRRGDDRLRWVQSASRLSACPGDVGTGAVIKPLVMLPEEIDTVVTRVWRANKGVDVITRGHDIVERNARMMIELDQHDGAMDPVVEGTIIGYRAHPGKVGLIEMPIDFAHLHPGVAFGGPASVGGGQGPQAAALSIGQVGGADSSEGNHGVVPERASLHPAIEGVLQLSGKVVGMDRGPEDGAG